MLALIASGGIVFVAGCGNRGIVAPPTVPVGGTVLKNGKPALDVRVKFHPQFDIGPVKFIPSGTTDSKGKFSITTAKFNDGAPPGEYLVTFEKIVLSGSFEEEVDSWKGKYANPESSKFKVEINGQVDLEPFRLD